MRCDVPRHAALHLDTAMGLHGGTDISSLPRKVVASDFGEFVKDDARPGCEQDFRSMTWKEWIRRAGISEETRMGIGNRDSSFERGKAQRLASCQR